MFTTLVANYCDRCVMLEIFFEALRRKCNCRTLHMYISQLRRGPVKAACLAALLLILAVMAQATRDLAQEGSVTAAYVAAQLKPGSTPEKQVTSGYVRPPARLKRDKELNKSLRSSTVGSEATQVRISMNGPDGMHITWITKEFGNPSSVEYGTAAGVYNTVAVGKSTSYSYLLYKSGEIHDVDIGPLQDATTYYYRLGGGSVEYTFKTPPGLGPKVPINFAVSGDLGQTSWTDTTLDHIKGSDYDVMLNVGDLAYADYYQPLWDSFGLLLSPLTRCKPWMMTEGNHEKEYIPFFIEAFRAYNARWTMPFEKSGSSSNLYYSFEVAGCHILMLGSYADYSTKSEQYKWLQADLAKVDRSKTPWLIAVLHAPWYNSNNAHQGDGAGMMATIEPLLFKAKTDILFAGHVHAYERTTRVYKGVANPLGILHLTIGDGGNREGLAESFIDPQPGWSIFREASFGHGRLDVQNSTTAHWSWHRNDDDVDVVADEVWITSLSDPNNAAYTTAIPMTDVTKASKQSFMSAKKSFKSLKKSFKS